MISASLMSTQASALPTASWIVSQIGGREHYAIPRGLARRQLLQTLVTDLWCPRWLSSVGLTRVPWKPIQRWTGRFAEGLDGKVAYSNVRAGLVAAFHYGRRAPDRVYSSHVEHGRWFARRTARIIERTPGGGVFFGYCTGSLEALIAAKERGLFTIVDQIDPALEEWKLVDDERERFPGWEERPPAASPRYWDRLHAEWATADLVVVNSEWSRENLVKQGVPPGKLAVVPLAYDASARSLPTARRPRAKAPLQVLWLGTVILRKGIPYLMEAARMLPQIQFHVAGPILISQQAVRAAPANVKFYGQVPHVRSPELFRAADVFLLPTISDGFAITQLEAMAYGLPVITTRHCGRVVTDGHNGYVIPARDAESLAARLAALDADRDLLEHLSANARAAVAGFSLEKTTETLLTEVGRRRS